MRHIIAFLFGALVEWTAATCYHLNYNDARVEAADRATDAAHARRGQAEANWRIAEDRARAALVELDAVRRAFFDQRHNWQAAPAAPGPELIPAQKLTTGQ